MIIIHILTFIIAIALMAAICSMISAVRQLCTELDRHNRWHRGQQLHHENPHRDEVPR